MSPSLSVPPLEPVCAAPLGRPLRARATRRPGTLHPTPCPCHGSKPSHRSSMWPVACSRAAPATVLCTESRRASTHRPWSARSSFFSFVGSPCFSSSTHQSKKSALCLFVSLRLPKFPFTAPDGPSLGGTPVLLLLILTVLGEGSVSRSLPLLVASDPVHVQRGWSACG